MTVLFSLLSPDAIPQIDAASIIHDLYAAFGGGGSGSGGSGGGSGSGGGGGSGGSFDSSRDQYRSGDDDDEMPVWVFVLIVVAAVGAPVFSAIRNKRARAANRPDSATVQKHRWGRLVSEDPSITQDATESWLNEAVVALNNAWSARDTSVMKPYLSADYFQKISVIVTAFEALGRRNEVLSVRPLSTVLLTNHPSDTQPRKVYFKVTYHCSDRLLDSDGLELMTHDGPVNETWKLQRVKQEWQLAGIVPQTVDSRFKLKTIEEFASNHELHYSADFGRLLLPDKGVLFQDASLTKSDVNNHVVGYRRDQLIQLYSYVANPTGDPNKQITVAQSVLPRSVTDIVVLAQASTISRPKNLQKQTLESAAFNEQWQVYADQTDQIATFELLNPVFMEKLTTIDAAMGLEAVGSNLYIFDESGTISYSDLLALLDEAFDELKL